MRFHLKQYTEPIFDRLAAYRAELEHHDLLVLARSGELPRHVLHEFAFHQYSDSILWIPMLAQMKSKAQRSRRLRQAITDNIAHEAGLDGESHVTLAVDMMRSLGISRLDGLPIETFARSATLWLSDEFVNSTEPGIAGWLLVAESLVPVMFAAALPSFERTGCDTRYFSQHVSVDTDEHASWMSDAVEDVLELYGADAMPDIVAGMEDAWQEVREVPDQLWRSRCASH